MGQISESAILNLLSQAVVWRQSLLVIEESQAADDQAQIIKEAVRFIYSLIFFQNVYQENPTDNN